MQRDQRRQNQKGTENVRILEETAGPAIQRQEIVAAGNEVEVAENAGNGCDDRASDTAAAELIEPLLRLLREHHGKEQGRSGHVPRRCDPVDDRNLVEQVDRGRGVAEVDENQQHQQRQKQQPHPQPRGEEDDERSQRRELIGARFEADDRAAEPDHP